MIDPRHPSLPVKRQCALIGISRSSWYGPASSETPLNLALMKLIDAQFMETPFYGSRQMARHLRNQGYCVSRKRVRRLMAKIGFRAVYQMPRTTVPHPEHLKYPYLLRNLVIDRPNQVWCADITYIPMQRGFLYLVAIMDWATRRVLAWRLSNTMDVEFCIEALEEALARHGRPEIFNMEHGRATGSSGHATPGQSMHQPAVHQGAAGCGGEDRDGRARPLDGQCDDRAAMAVAEV